MLGIDDVITAVSTLATKAIERIFPDPAQAAAAKLELLKMQQTGELAQLAAQTDLIKGQLDINKTEAASSSVFVAGWRPWIGWGCGTTFIINIGLLPLVSYLYALYTGHAAPELPKLDPVVLDVMGLILGGNIGVRTLEKIKGVAS